MVIFSLTQVQFAKRRAKARRGTLPGCGGRAAGPGPELEQVVGAHHSVGAWEQRIGQPRRAPVWESCLVGMDGRAWEESELFVNLILN